MAGDALARSLGQLLIPAVIAWGVTRKSTAQKKAQAVFIVGLLMLVTNLVVSYNSSRTDAAQREYLKTALIINAEGEAQLQALAAKFEAVNIAGALTMENFVYPDRRASAKATVAQYKALLFERKALIAERIAKGRQHLDSLPAGAGRERAEKSFKQGVADIKGIYDGMDAAQLAYVETVETLLTWADTQRIQLSSDGQPLFETQAALDKFRALLGQLTEREAAFNASVQLAQTKQAAMQQDMAKVKLEAEKLAR